MRKRGNCKFLVKFSILTSIISEWMFNEEKSENGIFQLDENGKMERKCSSHGSERRGEEIRETRI